MSEWQEKIAQDAFVDELEKIALSPKTLASAARKSLSAEYRGFVKRDIRGGDVSVAKSIRSILAKNLNKNRKSINKAITESKNTASKTPIRDLAESSLSSSGRKIYGKSV